MTRCLATLATAFCAMLAAAQDDYGDVPAHAGLLPLPGSVGGNINSASDVDLFRLDLPGRASLRIRTLGPTNTRGELLDATGARLASDEDSGPEDNFSIVSEELDAGVYYVEVRASEPGDYAVHVVVADTRDQGETPESSALLPLSVLPEAAYWNLGGGGSRSISARSWLVASTGSIWPDTTDLDMFRIDVPDDGTHLQIRWSARHDTYLSATLYNRDGAESPPEDSNGYWILDAGIYYLAVTGGGIGPYRVLAAPVPRN